MMEPKRILVKKEHQGYCRVPKKLVLARSTKMRTATPRPTLKACPTDLRASPACSITPFCLGVLLSARAEVVSVRENMVADRNADIVCVNGCAV